MRHLAISTGLLAAISTTPAIANEVEGTWQSIGYGLVITIDADGSAFHQISSAGCVPMVNVDRTELTENGATLADARITGLGEYMDPLSFDVVLNDDLIEVDLGKLNPLKARRIDAIPAECATPPNADALATFDVFWTYFDENFPFFELRGVDWQETRATFRPMVEAGVDDETLKDIFEQMLTPFGDGHISVITPMGEVSAIAIPDWANGMEAEDIFTLAHGTIADRVETVATAHETILYGRTPENLGYITITGFDGELLEGDPAGISQVIEQILTDLSGIDALVIDARINFGGEDTVGYALASHLTDREIHVGSKSVWENGAWIPLMDLSILPNGGTMYNGDVYLLTSKLTISAAETFALALAQMDNVTLVGEPSNGMLSDQFFVALPNGWIATISNEQYLDADGQLYEASGVPVDVPVAITRADIDAGIDRAYAEVLRLTGK